MKTKNKIIGILKNTKLLWSLVAVIGFWIGVYAFTWPPVGCTPGNCEKPLTQDYANQRVGVNTSNPQVTLDVNGGMRIGRMTTAELEAKVCTGSNLGTLVYDTDEDVVKVCKSEGWGVNVEEVDYLYSFSEQTFTNCGKNGNVWPSLSQCKTIYNTVWDENPAYLAMTNNGIQEWTVPETATYNIEVAGAQWGSFSGQTWGRGVIVKWDFALTEWEKIQILVWQIGSGGDYTNWPRGDGGGGTFVVKSDDTPLIIAGWGGGCWGNGDGYDASFTESSNGACVSSGGDGGLDEVCNTVVENEAQWGGGGGFYGDGTNSYLGGRAFVSWGEWGYTNSYDQWGFGGGGSAGADYGDAWWWGGYSGGHCRTSSAANPAWGWGGSYNVGSNQENVGYNSWDGYVTITKF